MWKRFEVELRMKEKFASGIPKNPETLLKTLKAREGKGDKPVPFDEWAEQIAEEVKASPEEEEVAVGFKRDEHGLYYEDRNIKAHLKDLAGTMNKFFGIRNLKSIVASHLFVEPPRIYVDKKEPDGYEIKPIRVMVPSGPRSAIKKIDYVLRPTLRFKLKILDDGVIKDWKSILEKLFEYGSEHGLGQERSEGWGRYEFELKEI